MEKHPWFDGLIYHEAVDDDDDHRVIVMLCGTRDSWVPWKARERWPKPAHVTCLLCLMIEQELS